MRRLRMQGRPPRLLESSVMRESVMFPAFLVNLLMHYKGHGAIIQQRVSGLAVQLAAPLHKFFSLLFHTFAERSLFVHIQAITVRSPRCFSKGTKSRSLCSRGKSFSTQKVAIRQSMVERTVMPFWRNRR